jgi:Zn finger protein HypA/HybF involved in hydrogenase expression
MKINVEKNLVEFEPENSDETVKLEALWRLLVDCVRFNKKLVPMGEFIPKKKNLARFAIEGGEKGSSGTKDAFPEAYADRDCRAYCQTCNKYVELKKGDRIPPCCGKLMEVLD